jgi:hypothetical protein
MFPCRAPSHGGFVGKRSRVSHVDVGNMAGTHHVASGPHLLQPFPPGQHQESDLLSSEHPRGLG